MAYKAIVTLAAWKPGPIVIPIGFTTLAIAVLVLLVVVAAAYLVVTYNRLVRRRNLVDEGWAGIDVQLRRRHDLVPNLVETVKGYAQHEQSVLEEATSLRNLAAGDQRMGDRQDHENALTGRIKTLFAIAEAYPDLKASTNFRDLSEQLVEIEDQLQRARRYYNGAARDLNIMVESFPPNLIAGVAGFTKRDYFEVEGASVRSSPEVQL